MKEAIGATWLLGIVLTFIALFSGYLAFSINYSKAFRMKNGIVERIEKHGGPNREALDDISNLMNDISYSSKGKCSNFFNNDELKWGGISKNQVTKSWDVTSGEAFNYCLQRVDSYNTNGQLSASYYKVYVFFSISLPVINTSSFFNVTGETSNIYFPEDCVTSRGRC